MKQFIKLTTSICLCLFAFTNVKAQNDNTCVQAQALPFQEWHRPPGFENCADVSCGVGISFKYGMRTTGGTICGVGLKWRWYNSKVDKDGHYEVTIQYRDFDGQVLTSVERLDLDKTGVWEGSGNYFAHAGKEPVSVSWKYINTNKDKAKSLTDDVNTTVTDYNKQYDAAVATANKVKDPTKHNQLIQEINANKNLFHQYKQQAQDELNNGNGDAMAQTLDKMKQQQNDLHTIYLRIDPDEPSTTPQNKTTTSNNSPIKITESQINTTINTNTQQQILQQQQENTKMVTEANNQLIDHAANLVNWLLQSSFNTSEAKRKEKDEAYEQNVHTTQKLIQQIPIQNQILAGGVADMPNEYGVVHVHGADLDKVTNIVEYVTNALKLEYYQATNMINFGILNCYAKEKCKNLITTTGNYILVKENYKQYKNTYRTLELENYILPDEFYFPICKLSDNTIARQPLAAKALGFLTDCNKCKNLMVSKMNSYVKESIDCNNKAAYKNTDSALYYMRLYLKTPQINTNVDVLDYVTIRIWYNMLKMQNAKTTSDLLELMKANVDFYNHLSDFENKAKSISEYRDGDCGFRCEPDFFETTFYIGNYYLYQALLAYYETNKTNGSDIVKLVSTKSYEYNYFYNTEKASYIQKIIEQAK